MDDLVLASEATIVHITSFTPYNTILTWPQIYFLENNNFINVTGRKCLKRSCELPLQFVESKRFKSDGFGAQCKKHKRTDYSIREGSFFSKHKMAIAKQIYIIDHLAHKCNTASIRGLLREQIDRETITKVLSELQQLMLTVVYNNKPKFDITDHIEIDEMYIDWEIPDNQDGGVNEKLKGKGGTWLLGIINRERTKVWVEPIKNRGKKEIFRVLDTILPDSKATIFTDALTTYALLDSKHIHFVINKSKQGFGRKSYRLATKGKFIKSKRIFEQIKKTRAEWIVHVNVNMIENNWMLLRKLLVLRQAYRHPHKIINHVAEYLFNFYKYSWLDLVKMSK
jgi:hypothetical protein